jgi:hypothetical protein
LVINYEDAQVGAIPGLYSSVESPNFKPNFHLSWPHLHFPNKYVDERGSTSLPEIEWLFSFTGSCSHAFRQRLFERYSHRTDDIHVQEIKRWYNHSETEALNYVTEIQKSAFVLCPRGIASYSHRIIETLALGRVPVVIADDWTPFSIDESDYLIRVAEKDVDQLEEILRRAMNDYAQIQARAQAVYLHYFSPSQRYPMALKKLAQLAETLSPNIDSDFLKHRLNSRDFRAQNGWLVHQRIRNRLSQMWQKISRRP